MMRKFLPYFFCCQIATLGLLRQTPTYSLWEELIYGYPLATLWIARILSVVVVFAATYFFYKEKSFIQYRSLVLISGAFLVVSLFLTFYFSQTMIMYLIGQICIGITHALILLSWVEWLATMSRKSRNKCIAISALLASFFFLVIGLVPSFVRPVLFIVITAGSIIPLLFAFTTPEDTDASSDAIPLSHHSFLASLLQGLRTISWELVLLMLCYSLLFRITVFLELSSGYEFLVLIWGATIRILGMTAMLVYLARKDFVPNIKQIALPLIFLTTIGVAILSGTEGALGAFSVALIESSWTFFYVIIWLVLLELSRFSEVKPPQFFALGWGILNVLLLLAAPTAYVLREQVSTGVLSLTALCLVVIYTLLVGMFLFGRKKLGSGISPEQGAKSATDWKKKQEELLHTMALERGLTKRETDVFILLAQGYSLTMIEEKLVLSHSTVKGHARHIYEKYDVRSKQELLKQINISIEESSA